MWDNREFLECLVFCSTWCFPNTAPIDFNCSCDYSTFQQWAEQGSWKMRMKYIMKYEKLIQVSWRTSIKHCSSSNRIWLTQRSSVMLSGDFLSLLVVFCHVPYMYFKMCVCIYAHIHTHTLCLYSCAKLNRAVYTTIVLAAQPDSTQNSICSAKKTWSCH